MDGMIPLYELSRKRITCPIEKLTPIGFTFNLEVLRVYQERGYIDLSLKSVYDTDLCKFY